MWVLRKQALLPSWFDCPHLLLRVLWPRAHLISAPWTDVGKAELIWPWRFSEPQTETHSAANAPIHWETFQNVTLHLFTAVSSTYFYFFFFFFVLRVVAPAKAYLVKCRETFWIATSPSQCLHRHTDTHNHPCGQFGDSVHLSWSVFVLWVETTTSMNRT